MSLPNFSRTLLVSNFHVADSVNYGGETIRRKGPFFFLNETGHLETSGVSEIKNVWIVMIYMDPLMPQCHAFVPFIPVLVNFDRLIIFSTLGAKT